MRTTEVYEVTCAKCGTLVTTVQTITKCPKCGVHLELHWGGNTKS